MLVVTLFAAVFADEEPVHTLNVAAWGGFSAENCTDNTKDVAKCLNTFSHWSRVSITPSWKKETCELSFPKEDGDENEWCIDGTYKTGAATCCGNSCGASILADSEIFCSKTFGIDMKTVERLGTKCDSDAEDTTCSKFAEKIMEKTGTAVVLECKETRCVPKAGAKPDDKKPDDEKPDDKKTNGTKPAEGNAFAMGLSTLAGALVILQL